MCQSFTIVKIFCYLLFHSERKLNEPRCCTKAEGRKKSNKPRAELETSVPMDLFDITGPTATSLHALVLQMCSCLSFNLSLVQRVLKHFREL